MCVELTQQTEYVMLLLNVQETVLGLSLLVNTMFS